MGWTEQQSALIENDKFSLPVHFIALTTYRQDMLCV